MVAAPVVGALGGGVDVPLLPLHPDSANDTPAANARTTIEFFMIVTVRTALTTVNGDVGYPL
jgi:hypothetical protein